MKKHPDNELLSAYLDGELTAAEQSRVERLLAGDTAAKQLLDELLALKAAVQSLPREGVGEDLSPRIFQIAAERKMSGPDSPPSSEPEHSRPRLVRQIADRFQNNPRMIVWPLVIVTVAVLLMVFNPESPGPAGGGNRNIVQAPKDRNTGKMADIENRANDAKLILPDGDAQVRNDNQPSMRAADSPEGPSTSSQYAVKDVNSAESKLPPPVVESPSNLFVVDCEVIREVLELEDFRKILATNDITWSDEAAGDAILMTPSELAEAAGLARAIESEKSEDQGANSKMEMVFVEATPAQIGAMLNGLKAMPEKFHAVSIKAPSLNRPTPAELGEKGSAVKMPQPAAQRSTVKDSATAEKPISRAQRVPRSAIASPPSSPAAPSTASAAPQMQRVLFILHVVEK
jgi:anti-sigma factor RsiW